MSAESPKTTLRALAAARKAVASGELAGIFAEGSITRTGHVQPFQRGFERIVDGTDAPIVPIYISGLYGHPLSVRGGKIFARWPRPLRALVTIRVGAPIREKISPAALRDKVIELSSEACEMRKGKGDTLAHRFIQAARRNWSRMAMADSSGKQLTYGQAMTAGWLAARRLPSSEQNIGILLPSSIAGALANIAVTLAGKTAVNLDFTAARCELQTIITSRKFLEEAKFPEIAHALYIEDLLTFSTAEKLRASIAARWFPPPRVNPDAIAAITFSGAELTHWNIVSNIDAIAQVYDVEPGDVMPGAPPFLQSFGYTFTLWFPLLNEFGATFEGYGCTEMGPVIALNTPNANRPGSVGQPLPGVSVRIVDPETLAPAEEGLLLVKGPSLMKGYLRDPARTKASLHQGYYITGDIARVDAEGFLHIVGRLAPVSKIAGETAPHLKIEELAGNLWKSRD